MRARLINKVLIRFVVALAIGRVVVSLTQGPREARVAGVGPFALLLCHYLNIYYKIPGF